MDKREFKRRRKRLMDIVDDGGIAIQPTAPEQVRNRDVHFPFRPDSDFAYLTNFPEPEALAVLVPDRPQGEYILFCRERDPHAETWHGRRAGVEGAVERYGADDAFPISDLDDILPGLLENRERIFYSMGRYPDFDHKLMGWVNDIRARARAGVHAPDEFIDLSHHLHEMRLVKSKSELVAMRKAAKASVAAHKQAMRLCQPGIWEYQVEAELLHGFMHGGCRSTAYPPIVGGGANSCILHYTENNCQLNDGDVLLIDAGGEYEYYASDITRTFPVNGTFSSAQREIYEIVLAAQHAAFKEARAGNHWNAPHEAAVEEITRGLVSVGLLKGRVSKLIKDGAYRDFYMHRTGHWLGMDVHDVGDYKIGDEWRTFEPGMVLTVEPGLYLAAGAPGVTKRWENIGIRIEDDVLITDGEPEVLTAALATDPDEIEALVQATA